MDVHSQSVASKARTSLSKPSNPHQSFSAMVATHCAVPIRSSPAISASIGHGIGAQSFGTLRKAGSLPRSRHDLRRRFRRSCVAATRSDVVREIVHLAKKTDVASVF